MSADFFDVFGYAMALTLLVPLVIIGVIVVLVVWAIQRNAPARDNPAVTELKVRYARGEIDTAEYQVRLRELTED